MRQIKFRGKSNTGVWVYGSLIYFGEQPQIEYVVRRHPDDNRVLKTDWVYVNPESVGQFTGLFDKNGTEIYEGDIIDYVKGEYRKSKSDHWEPQIERFVVSFKKCAFRPIDCLSECKDFLHIKGNVYDNPGLLNEKP